MPPRIERDGDGSYLYRWDVREETREMGDDMAPVISYSYNEVRIWATLTANKILEACINALWDKDVEQKKLNDYNAAQLGILDLSYVHDEERQPNCAVQPEFPGAGGLDAPVCGL